jgi:hypothetical protein
VKHLDPPAQAGRGGPKTNAEGAKAHGSGRPATDGPTNVHPHRLTGGDVPKTAHADVDRGPFETKSPVPECDPSRKDGLKRHPNMRLRQGPID